MKLTDSGNAEALIQAHGDVLRYCPPMRAWYIWGGRVWREDTNGGILQLTKQVARGYGDVAEKMEADDPQRKRLFKWALDSEGLRYMQSAITIAQSDVDVCVDAAEFDRDPMLLTVENGTLDLESGKFRTFDPDDYITHWAPVTYTRDAHSTLWEDFLASIIPDPATRDFIQAAVGYSLTGSMEEDKMFILYGDGRNGKTTFVNAIMSMMGGYSAQASSQAIMHKRGDGPTNELFVLRGKRFVAATETGESRHLNECLVKQMTGGDPISVNPKYRSQIEFIPTWKLWLSTNHEPQIIGTDTAIWRRLLKIPFSVTIPEAQCDTKLKPMLSTRSERSGILNWALEGTRMWRKSGLKPSPEVAWATTKYRAGQDYVAEFLSECCIVSPQNTVSKSVMYQKYVMFCKQNYLIFVAKNVFGRRLHEIGISESRDTKSRFWVGISMGTYVNLNPIHMEDYK